MLGLRAKSVVSLWGCVWVFLSLFLLPFKMLVVKPVGKMYAFDWGGGGGDVATDRYIRSAEATHNPYILRFLLVFWRADWFLPNGKFVGQCFSPAPRRPSNIFFTSKYRAYSRGVRN